MHGQRCWIHLKILFDELGGVTRVCRSDYTDLVLVFFVSSSPNAYPVLDGETFQASISSSSFFGVLDLADPGRGVLGAGSPSRGLACSVAPWLRCCLCVGCDRFPLGSDTSVERCRARPQGLGALVTNIQTFRLPKRESSSGLSRQCAACSRCPGRGSAGCTWSGGHQPVQR